MTSSDTQSLRDDLAFLRALVEPDDGGHQRVFGQGYFAAGVCYGVQLLMSAGQTFGILPSTGWVSLATGLAPTVAFLVLLTWILVRGRRSASGAGLPQRAVGAVFGTLGMSNLGLLAIIGWVALREHSLTTWLIYPCCVYLLQGAAWIAALAVRRRRWFSWVAAGWVASAIGMAASIGDMAWYLAFAGVGLILCMALPGWRMMRSAPPASAPAVD